ncbi:MAG: CRISPR-associated ring nuclease Csm6 [Akkermansia sp.]
MKADKVVLISVVGMTPAVLTETIWALYQERPELLPDEVVVYTTEMGAKGLETIKEPVGEEPSIWQQLSERVGKPGMLLRSCIFKDRNDVPLKDIVSGADQQLVADQLLHEIRGFKSELGDSCSLVASIAGGRKSMSALMYAAMSLGGDAGDIITHVLADERASDCQDFFFPEQEKQALCTRHGGQPFAAAEVRLELAEIPFVPLRALVGEAVSSARGSFATLVNRARQRVQEAAGAVIPKVVIDCKSDKLLVEINGKPISWVKEQEQEQFALMCLLMYLYEHGWRGKRADNEPSFVPELRQALHTLKNERRLPEAVLQRMQPQRGDVRKVIAFYAFLMKQTDPSLMKQSDYVDDSFARIKSYLKKSLSASGQQCFEKDLLSKRVLCFPKHLDIKWKC